MALLLLSIVVIGFVLFFYGIGLRYFALIPLLFIGMFFGYYGAAQTIKVQGTDLLKRYSLYVARIIILAGLTGLFNFFGFDLVSSTLGLIAINLMFRILSYLIDYQDGKSVFRLGFYFCMFLLLIVSLSMEGRAAFFNVFAMLRVLHLAIDAFFIFIVGLVKEVEKHFQYELMICFVGTVFLVVFDQIKNIYLALTINGGLLIILYSFIAKYFKITPPTAEQKKELSVRRILAGERITGSKIKYTSKTATFISGFLTAIPKRTTSMLELLNIVLVIVLIIQYITHVGDFAAVNHLLYWAVIVIFVANVLLLKKVGYNSIIQNLVVFLVVNFAIYVSLFSYFNGDAGAVATWGIIRNVASALMIFYAHRVPMLAKIFNKTDYIYWIISCVAAMVVNVILLISTTLPGELIFFLVLVYVGLQSMIIYYAARYLGKIQTLN